MEMQLMMTYTLILTVLLLGLSSMTQALPATYTRDKQMSEEGVASYYDDSSVDPRWGGKTKSGALFSEVNYTVAVPPHRWKELKHKVLRITNRKTGRMVKVRVTDTGNMELYGRTVDLSKGAFQQIASPKEGLANVIIEVDNGDDT